MDILKPTLIRINGRCYRKNLIETEKQQHFEEEDKFGDSEFPETRCYQDDCGDDDDEACDAGADLEQTENGYRLTMAVPEEFFKYIIGKKGETRKRLENETKTQIRIPKQGQAGDVVIVGRDRRGTLSARTRIEILTESARQRHPLTHFLSLPAAVPGIVDRLGDFKDDVCRKCSGDRGVDATIFQNPKKLHLTLGTLVLLTPAEISRAEQLLVECQRDLVGQILRDAPLYGRLHGLEYMNDDPSAVDVLYAKVQLDDNSDRLQLLVDRLVERFRSSGLMQRDYERVKLHATVMNTLLRRDPTGTAVARRDPTGTAVARRDARDRESFDATNILQLYGDYDFGPYHINTVHLSEKFTSGPDGYYTCHGKIDLP